MLQTEAECVSGINDSPCMPTILMYILKSYSRELTQPASASPRMASCGSPSGTSLLSLDVQITYAVFNQISTQNSSEHSNAGQTLYDTASGLSAGGHSTPWSPDVRQVHTLTASLVGWSDKH